MEGHKGEDGHSRGREHIIIYKLSCGESERAREKAGAMVGARGWVSENEDRSVAGVRFRVQYKMSITAVAVLRAAGKRRFLRVV